MMVAVETMSEETMSVSETLPNKSAGARICMCSKANTTATWYDAQGQGAATLNLPPGHYETVSISPDGTHAVFVRSTSPSESALWLVDLARGSASPLSSGRGRNRSAAGTRRRRGYPNDSSPSRLSSL